MRVKQGAKHDVLWSRFSWPVSTNPFGWREAQEEQRLASAAPLAEASTCNPLPFSLHLALSFKWALLFPFPRSPPSLI